MLAFTITVMSTCRPTKIAKVASGSYEKKAAESTTAMAQSIAIAAMRRPKRPTDRGPDSGRPRRSPGHAGAGAEGVSVTPSAYEPASRVD